MKGLGKLKHNATYFWDTGHHAWIVGQDGNRRWSACLQAIPAGYQPAAGFQPAPQFLPDSRFWEKYVALS
jgi:hypothetical protein